MMKKNIKDIKTKAKSNLCSHISKKKGVLRYIAYFNTNIKYSQLSLSRIPRDSLKHFEISVPRHIRVERVRKTIN